MYRMKPTHQPQIFRVEPIVKLRTRRDVSFLRRIGKEPMASGEVAGFPPYYEILSTFREHT